MNRWKKLAVTTAVAMAFGAGVFLNMNGTAHSGGETRTLSLYHVHTKESLTITYMKDGRYIPSAMKKINYLMRDWRRNEVITISPRTIDLMWELHADLGSKAPIHIVCGYRSPKTNAFLKKVGRNVARKSQHMVGQAIDLYFPDVPTVKIRNSALVRQVGGVGYYSSGAGPTGFLHIDSGNVRHWGPAISSYQMAKIMRDYRKTVGARLNKNGTKAVPEVMVAEADPTAARLPSQMEGDDEGDAENVKQLSARKKIPLETAYSNGDDEELAGMSEDAAAAPAKPKLKPETAETAETAEDNGGASEAVIADADGVNQGYPTPKPRPKPIEVLMMAAVNMNIEPASAPPPDPTERASPVAGNSQGVVIAPESMTDTASLEANGAEKTSLTEDIENGDAQNVPTIRTITASASGDDLFWWPAQLVFDTNRAVRRDGAPQQFSAGSASVAAILPGAAEAGAQEPQPQRLAIAQMAPSLQESAPGKGDMQVVNREGKGSLLTPLKPAVQLGQADPSQ
ncbi:MAG: DUF882 domain-containing protein [Aestuariivirga sp.]|uniref:DUF882 domain-containing protein n=1 Tax=Aestuariivirga sp. TaxID=2650926 RepID=UPI0025C60FF2|nr:DUF882 domain-containing protein [Aestuariivirga sp.]MCA3562035.1 DUF882 domain-containing protein [Aestuariivirga sp.]